MGTLHSLHCWLNLLLTEFLSVLRNYSHLPLIFPFDIFFPLIGVEENWYQSSVSTAAKFGCNCVVLSTLRTDVNTRIFTEILINFAFDVYKQFSHIYVHTHIHQRTFKLKRIQNHNHKEGNIVTTPTPSPPSSLQPGPDRLMGTEVSSKLIPWSSGGVSSWSTPTALDLRLSLSPPPPSPPFRSLLPFHFSVYRGTH